jgi:hypothetical protein
MEKPDLPKTFTDSLGRAWTVTIVWSTCKRIKDIAGVVVDDLILKKKGEDPLSPFVKLVTDPEALLAVLWAICKPQCDAAKIELGDFCDGIVGNTLIDAKNAFCQALYDFFPDPQKSILGGAIAMGIKHEAKAMAKLESEGTKLQAAAMARLDQEISTIDLVPDFLSKLQSFDAPASAASTPTP